MRWTAALVCAGCAVVGATAAPDDSAVIRPITVAARDIPSGATLAREDLAVTTATLPFDTVAPDDLVGEVSRGPLTAGEPVTVGRVVPGGRVAPDPGTVVFPLTLADERIAALLHSGDRVDVVVTPDALHEGDAHVVARNVEVLTVAGEDGAGFAPASATSGAVVLLAVPETGAAQLAAIRTGDHVSVAIR